MIAETEASARGRASTRSNDLLLWQAAWQLAGLSIWLLFELLRLHPDRAIAALADPVSWLLLLVPAAASLTTWVAFPVAPWPVRSALAVGSALLSSAALLLLILLVGTPIHLALGGHL